jgi:hypothetical protein
MRAVYTQASTERQNCALLARLRIASARFVRGCRARETVDLKLKQASNFTAKPQR